MARKEQPKPKHIASTLDEVAAFFGVARDTLRDWRRSGMPGATGCYPLSEVAQWLRRDGPWRVRPAADDLGSGDSPGLERYREARAELAELDLAERREELIDRGLIRSKLIRLIGLLRACSDRLEKRFGADAKRMVHDTLGEWQRAIAKELGK